MNDPLLWYDVPLRLLAAIVCGGVLGWERETHGKSAGFRTNMVISLGAAAFTIISIRLATATGLSPASQVDPARAVQGVIGGIGFLGAGAIIQSGKSVRGMTTAATIWVVGAIGVACGVGSFDIAFITAAMCLLMLTGGDIFATFMGKRSSDLEDEGSGEQDDEGSGPDETPLKKAGKPPPNLTG